MIVKALFRSALLVVCCVDGRDETRVIATADINTIPVSSMSIVEAAEGGASGAVLSIDKVIESKVSHSILPSINTSDRITP